jgi:hypothetical protein
MSTIKVINDEDNIKIEVSGKFYKKLQSTLFFILGSLSEKDQIEALGNVRSGKITNATENELLTMLSLIQHIENSAEEQKLTKEMDSKEFVEQIKSANPDDFKEDDDKTNQQ